MVFLSVISSGLALTRREPLFWPSHEICLVRSENLCGIVWFRWQVQPFSFHGTGILRQSPRGGVCTTLLILVRDRDRIHQLLLSPARDAAEGKRLAKHLLQPAYHRIPRFVGDLHG